jgi:hypothetical protein
VIGVLCKPGQAAAVEELFELFKTPWEFYAPGRVYAVVVTTADDVPQVEARLVVVYGAETKSTDVRLQTAPGSRLAGQCVEYRGTRLPIYGEVLSFAGRGTPILFLGSPAAAAAVSVDEGGQTTIRVGYDVFEELRALTSAGQPVEHAAVPTLDLHIAMLRAWIVDARVPLLEIPPAPARGGFFACLTHDIDFVGIRRHRLDHTMWGFLYRSTVVAVLNVLRGRLSVVRLFKTWRAVASLPFVYLGWAKDFWAPFEWYLEVECDLPATYYLIPFKQRAGDRVAGRHAARRATAYDVTDADLQKWVAVLLESGCEVGVHGIDAWHSVEKGREELARVAAATHQSQVGIRMHWLLRDASTAAVLEQAGYAYDATSGYNDTIGYRAGTTQVFRPLEVKALLELPLHVQDGALFYPQRLDLSEAQAETRCDQLIEGAQLRHGVLTILWHDRSHGPERFWGDFYVGLVQRLKAAGAVFATAGQVVAWFRHRRDVRFDTIQHADGTRVRLQQAGDAAIQPPLRIVLHNAAGAPGETEISWDGLTPLTFDVSSSTRQPHRVPAPGPEAQAPVTAAS